MDEAEGIRQLNKQRPKHHPDFDRMTYILRVTDSEIDRGKSVEDVVGGFIDPATLVYVADQRAIRGMESIGLDIDANPKLRHLLSAMFVDGWINGKMFM